MAWRFYGAVSDCRTWGLSVAVRMVYVGGSMVLSHVGGSMALEHVGRTMSLGHVGGSIALGHVGGSMALGKKMLQAFRPCLFLLQVSNV